MAKILCVEDSEDNMFALHKRLSLAGFEVKVATNGETGVDWAKTLLPDLIVMDLKLPRLDGWEATRRLKADPATCDIPIIALSAHAMAGDREKALATGCDDFDTKPVEFDRLLAKVEQALAARDRGSGSQA